MIKIYSKQACPNCDIAIRLTKLKQIDSEIYKLDEDYSLIDLFKLASEAGVPNPRQFPVIFRDLEYIGGLDEFKQAIVDGKV